MRYSRRAIRRIACQCAARVDDAGTPLAAEPCDSILRQIAEDTCKAHGEFCCPLCFDMTPFQGDTTNPAL